MGQEVPFQPPRVRTTDDKEGRLGSYEMFHGSEPLTETVWDKLILGLSTRNCGQAIRQFTGAYGLEKSAISEHFIGKGRRLPPKPLRTDSNDSTPSGPQTDAPSGTSLFRPGVVLRKTTLQN